MTARATGTADGLWWEAHDGPSPDAASVILSAGLGGSAGFWGPQMAALTRRFRVILYDHRGTGRSVRTLTEPHTVQAMADDIVTVLDAVGVERAHLVGHAAGGNAGLALALSHPERLERLVVVNGWSRPDPHIARCFAARLRLLAAGGAEAYVEAQPLFLYPPDWISANSARLDAEGAHHVAAFPPEAGRRAPLQALLKFASDGGLPASSCPGLVSASADDMLVPLACSRRLAERLLNATLDVAPWGGHAFTVTAAEPFNATLVRFLEGD